MGGNQSSPEEDGQEFNAPEMTERMQEVLDENTYSPGEGAKYSYFLVQLNEDGELPFGDDDILVSDCISAYVAQNSITHIIAQTHGWNTPRRFHTFFTFSLPALLIDVSDDVKMKC